MRRPQHIALASIFIALIFSMPIAQALYDRLVLKTRPTVLNLFSRRPTEAHLRAFEHELDESSFVGADLRQVFQVVRYQTLRELGEKAVRGRDNWLFYAPDLSYLAEPYFRDLGAGGLVDDPVAVIVDFAAQLRARGIGLVVIPVPSKPSIHPEQLVPSLEPSAALSVNTDRLRRELEHRGVRTLDLHRVFLDARRQAAQQPLYMAADTHWNGDGVRIAAQAIALAVRREPWFRAATTQRYERSTLRVERDGDIPRMTQIPGWQRRFPRETVTCYRVVERAGGAPYEDDDASPILVLGDSFARVFESDAPEAAGVIANLAFELERPLASIVADGGASTLVRQDLAREVTLLDGKRLVIWLFAERDVRFGQKGWQRITL